MRRRMVKTVCNVLLGLLLLALLWSGLGRPLPWKWDYRRAERAMLLEPMEILCYDQESGLVLSVDGTYLGLFCHNWRGWTLFQNEMALFPLENGAGRALEHDVWFGTKIWAYEASGKAVRADLALELYHPDHGYETVSQSAQLQDGCFAFHVEGAEGLDSDWRDEILHAVVWWEVGHENQLEAQYQMTITFYDEAGSVTAIHESGGISNEDR